MSESVLPDPTRTAAPPAGSTTRDGEPLTAERTPSGTLSVQPEQLPRPFGRYELRRLLGRGGMGSVYLAHDAQLDRLVALKMPRPFGDDPALWRERFLTEARAAATLSHPNICPVHDVGEHDGQPYLTMAFIDGETLAARLKRDGRLPVGEAVGLVATVARAMAEAHARGIVHRDLKPGNLLLDRRNRPVVTDFGLALRASTADDLRLTLTGVAMGTPAYMPPEQAGGDVDAVGPASDVYALGVMLFELLTGRVPFRGRTFGQLLAQIERDPPPLPSFLADGIPPALDAVILTALAKAPADRFPTAAEFADALEQFQAGNHDELASRYGAALAAAEPALLAPVPPKKRTRRWPAVAAGLLGFAVLLLAGTIIYVRTDKGDLRVELSDPKADVRVEVNGQEVTLDPDGKPVRVRAGDNQKVVVSGADFETVSESFDLKRNGQSVVRVTLVPKGGGAVAAVPKADPPKPPPTPPKPVAFPKDRTLIEAGGWQILADATKEQAEAWLAERKKAKHSVTWLDAYPVGDKPLYSAVAALDDRVAGWEVSPEVSMDSFRKGDMGKPIPFDTNYPRSFSGFYRGDGPSAAVLWHPVTKGWNYSIVPDVSVKTLLDRAALDDEALAVLRPFPNPKGGLRWAYTVDRDQIQIKGSKPYPRIAPNELAATLDAVRKDGRVPLCLAAAAWSEGLLFALTTGRNADQREWQADTGLPADKLAEVAKEKAKVGFHPESVTAYAWDGAVRYCVVWVKDPPKPTPYPKDKVLVSAGGYETLLDATKEQMQAWLDEKKKAKHSVLWLDAVEVAGKPVFSAVAAHDDRQPKWRAYLDLTENEVNNPQRLEKRIGAEAITVLSLSGFDTPEGTRAALLCHPADWVPMTIGILPAGHVAQFPTLEKGSVMTVARPFPKGEQVFWSVVAQAAAGRTPPPATGWTEEQLKANLDSARKAGVRPQSLAAFREGNGLRFAALVTDNKDKWEWHAEWGLTADKLAEATKERAKLGFRPASVTAYAWDGAVRYCVVWVKDPPKPVPYPKDKTLVTAGGYETLLDATKEQMQSWLDEKKKAKHSVTWLDAYPVAGKPLYSAVAALDDRQPDWKAELDLSADTINDAPGLLKRLGWMDTTALSLGGFPNADGVRVAGLFIPEVKVEQAIGEGSLAKMLNNQKVLDKDGIAPRLLRPFPVRDGLVRCAGAFSLAQKANTPFDLDTLPAALAGRLDDARRNGFRPVAVSGYTSQEELRFAVSYEPTPAGSEWELLHTGTNGLTDAARERAKAGFRPSSLTAYAWDGAVRYCVVWVKDPPKKPEAKKDEPKK